MALGRLQFGLSWLFVLTLLAAAGALLYSYDPRVFWVALLASVVANLFGVAVGWFVTRVLGLPNDGSLAGDTAAEADCADSTGNSQRV